MNDEVVTNAEAWLLLKWVEAEDLYKWIEYSHDERFVNRYLEDDVRQVVYYEFEQPSFDEVVAQKASGRWMVNEAEGYSIIFLNGVPFFECYVEEMEWLGIIELPHTYKEAMKKFDQLYYDRSLEYRWI